MKNVFLTIMICAVSYTACDENSDMSADLEELKERTGYVVGYETCGLSLDNRKAQGYIVISEDLKDTLAVYGLPEIFEFPEEAFSATMSNDPGLINAAFPEKFRYAFKMQFTYTLSSEEEVVALGIKKPCVIPAMYSIRETYRNCVLAIINIAVACTEDDTPQQGINITYMPCPDKQTVKILENEPAIVRRNNIFQTEGKDISITIQAASIDTFAFELQNQYEGVMPCPVVSRYPIPEKYRIDGLEVKISGEITNCFVVVSAPYIRAMPNNIFELTSIK
jgi:hypothetical protein